MGSFLELKYKSQFLAKTYWETFLPTHGGESCLEKEKVRYYAVRGQILFFS